jgi:hypothetical protein
MQMTKLLWSVVEQNIKKAKKAKKAKKNNFI